MKEIEFDVLWWDENQAELNKIGIRPSLAECKTRPMTFYNIDNIAPYYENDKEYTELMSGGDEFIIPQPYSKIKQLLSSKNRSNTNENPGTRICD